MGSGASLRDIPVTWALIGTNVLTFLLAFLGMRTGLGESLLRTLALGPESLPWRPWSLLTWPLVAESSIINLLFSSMWAFTMGGSLERSWGGRRYAAFFFVCAALTAMTLWAGMRLLAAPIFASGLWLALAAPTVAWCLINRRETILLSFVLPVPAPVLAWLTVGLTFFFISSQGGHPLLGLFAVSGCAAAYLYVRNGVSLTLARRSGEGRPAGDRFADFDREGKGAASRNPLTKLAEERRRKERDKKLAEMFRRSGYDDGGDKR